MFLLSYKNLSPAKSFTFPLLIRFSGILLRLLSHIFMIVSWTVFTSFYAFFDPPASFMPGSFVITVVFSQTGEDFDQDRAENESRCKSRQRNVYADADLSKRSVQEKNDALQDR